MIKTWFLFGFLAFFAVQHVQWTDHTAKTPRPRRWSGPGFSVGSWCSSRFN